MSLNTPAKKSFVAFAVALPLALAACGSEDAGTEATSKASAAAESGAEKASEAKESATASKKDSPSKSQPASESKSAKPQAKAGDKEAAPAGDAAAAQGDAATEPTQNPFQGEQNPLEEGVEQPPVEGGQPASQADVDGINGLVRGLYETKTMRQFVRYMPDNTCQHIMQSKGQEMQGMDYNQIPDVPLDQVPNSNWGTVGVESIDNIQVNGDDASATVNVNTGEGLDSSIMRFKREGDRWTFCGQ